MQKNIFISFLLLFSFLFSDLLNTNDQVNNINPVLGGNPAIPAYLKVQKVDAGISFYAKNRHNSKVLGSDGKDRDPQQINNKFLNYINKINENYWLNVKYYNATTMHYSLSGTYFNDSDAKYEAYSQVSLENVGLGISRALRKDIYIGAEFISNTLTITSATEYNNYAKSTYPWLNDYVGYQRSLPFYSLQLGLIKIINDSNKIIFSHKLSQNMGIYWSGNGFRSYTYHEPVANETAIGYVHSFNGKFQATVTMRSFWERSFTTDYSYTDDQVGLTYFSYNLYGLAAEYFWSQDTTMQFFVEYCENMGRLEISDESFGKVSSGTEMTSLGININKKLSDDFLLTAGLFNMKWLSNDRDNGSLIDGSRFYLSGSYIFNRDKSYIEEPVKETEEEIPSQDKFVKFVEKDIEDITKSITVTSDVKIINEEKDELFTAKDLIIGYKKLQVDDQRQLEIKVFINKEAEVVKGSVIAGDLPKVGLFKTGDRLYKAYLLIPDNYPTGSTKVKIYLLRTDSVIVAESLYVDM